MNKIQSFISDIYNSKKGLLFIMELNLFVILPYAFYKSACLIFELPINISVNSYLFGFLIIYFILSCIFENLTLIVYKILFSRLFVNYLLGISNVLKFFLKEIPFVLNYFTVFYFFIVTIYTTLNIYNLDSQPYDYYYSLLYPIRTVFFLPIFFIYALHHHPEFENLNKIQQFPQYQMVLGVGPITTEVLEAAKRVVRQHGGKIGTGVVLITGEEVVAREHKKNLENQLIESQGVVQETHAELVPERNLSASEILAVKNDQLVYKFEMKHTAVDLKQSHHFILWHDCKASVTGQETFRESIKKATHNHLNDVQDTMGLSFAAKGLVEKPKIYTILEGYKFFF